MVPNLADYDIILINTSAGKDSQAMMGYVMQLAREAGVADLVHAVHADLGRVEWEGTKDLAAEHAAHYGIRLHVIKRPQGDLLEHVEQRRMWPDSQNRYCTSDHKRGQIAKVITALVQERKAIWGAMGQRRQVRILNCLGMRAQESPARSKLVPFEVDERNTNGRKLVHTWLPIHSWTVDQVWARNRAEGTRHHRAYDLGMPRLSCCFCIFAPKAALVIAGKANPALLDEYVRVEATIGHTFRQDLTLASVREAVRSGDPVVQAAGDWCM